MRRERSARGRALGRLTVLDGTVSQQLRRLIETAGVSREGRLAPERELVATLGVSRRALRHALAALEAEGRVVRRQGAGTFIVREKPLAAGLALGPIEQTTPLEVIEVRLTLEPMLARLATLRGARWDLHRLAQIAAETGRSKSPQTYEAADAAFHRAIAVAARNALFLGVFDAVMETIERASWHGVREDAHCSKRKAVYSRQHVAIAEAVSSHDADAAESLMRMHLSAVRDHLLAETYAPAGAPRTPPGAA